MFSVHQTDNDKETTFIPGSIIIMSGLMSIVIVRSGTISDLSAQTKIIVHELLENGEMFEGVYYVDNEESLKDQ